MSFQVKTGSLILIHRKLWRKLSYKIFSSWKWGLGKVSDKGNYPEVGQLWAFIRGYSKDYHVPVMNRVHPHLTFRSGIIARHIPLIKGKVGLPSFLFSYKKSFYSSGNLLTNRKIHLTAESAHSCQESMCPWIPKTLSSRWLDLDLLP